MGEYEPNDSRNVTGTASTQDGRWTGQAANDPTRQNRHSPMGQMQQSGQSVGQSGDGVSGAANQGNDHTSAIGQNRSGNQQQFDAGSAQYGSGGSGAGGAFADQIAKHQDVIDADGRHVGTVDHVDGDRIKLTRQDSADGEHHYVALSEVAGIEGGRVRLSGSGSQGSGGAM